MMNLLEFANPAGLWWAAVAVPIVLFYILKVRLRRQPVSTFMFWDQVFHEKKPRAWWQQLRHVLSLLLQMLLLALLVLALLDPLWQWQKAQRRKVLLVIDNSASMSADEEGRTRLQLAREAAASLVRSLRVGDEMAILSAGGKPEVAIGLTDHARTLLTTLDNIPQTDAPSALQDTVAAAKRLLVADQHSVIYVLTDGCDEATKALADDQAVNLVGFGSRRDNAGITQFQVRRSLLDAIGYQTLIEVSNFSDQPFKGRVELMLEDQLVDVIPVELDPEGHRTLHIDQASATGGRLVAKLDVDDALSTDNIAMAVLPLRKPIEVSLITPGSLFLKSVLESIPLVDLKLYIDPPLPTEPEALPTPTPTPTPTFDLPSSAQRSITILHQKVPNPLPPGKLLIINPRSDCDAWTIGGPLEQPIVASVSPDSPITQHVKLTNVLFPEAVSLQFTADVELLIKTPLDEPLLARVRRPVGDVLVLNVNLDQGDLPLRIAFPVMMKNALEWFEGTQGELQPAIATGSSTIVTLPKNDNEADAKNTLHVKYSAEADTSSTTATPQVVPFESGTAKQSEPSKVSKTQYWLRDPRGQRTPIASDSETATLSVMKLSGLWSIGTEDQLSKDPWQSDAAPQMPPNQLEAQSITETTAETSEANRQNVCHLACNLANRAESDLRPRVELRGVDQFGLLGFGGRSIWFYCVVTALALAATEWWLYQRRIVG